MPKATHLALLSLLLLSCAPVRAPSDPDTRQAQRELSSTVLVNVATTVTATFPGSKPQTKILGGHSGSGVILAFERGQSLVATVAHVCAKATEVEIPPEAKDIFTKTDVLQVRNILGDSYAGTVLLADDAADVCFLSVRGQVGTVARLAMFLPPIGARIQVVGAPAGIFGHNLGLVSDGRYGGLDLVTFPMPLETLSAVAWHGNSGGPVFDARGDVIGLLVAIAGQGGFPSLAIDLATIERLQVSALERWRR